ncbi:hypothetical protein [Xanthomonas oryzae]|uniref:Uncharacterized protein n=1 Tax=Xanthomonas oryzae pv. leersiae TaxID=3112258 RepID=A0AAJ6H185_9XANT|nr:hypothetical protein [Xanthomonas oryzae]WIX06641.1 hypothetical protein QN060_22035 [Xanthomonas oryzae pv. oryzae]
MTPPLMNSQCPAMKRDARETASGLPKKVNLTLRFPHISSFQIKHLLRQDVEEGARMGHASR